MIKRSRVFIFETLIDSCRLLPEKLQAILFMGFFGVMSLLVPTGLTYFLDAVIILQLIFILVLAHKNIIYKRISKLENAIKYKIIWIKTKNDQAKTSRYSIMSLIMFILTLLLYWYFQNQKLLFVCILLCALYFLKNIFYVPIISIRIIEGYKFQFIDEIEEEISEFNTYLIKEIEVGNQKIQIITNKSIINISVEFESSHEKERLIQFLNGVNLTAK